MQQVTERKANLRTKRNKELVKTTEETIGCCETGIDQQLAQ
jgi:hypothetical protein